MTSQAQDFELPRKDHHLQGLVELHPQDAGDGVNVSLSLASQAYCRNSDSDPLGSLLPHSLFVVSNGYGQVLASYALFLHSHFENNNICLSSTHIKVRLRAGLGKAQNVTLHTSSSFKLENAAKQIHFSPTVWRVYMGISYYCTLLGNLKL